MGGHQNRVVLILDELPEHVQNILPYHRIQTAGGLVQDEELGMVREGNGDAELSAHPVGESLKRLVLGQLEPFQVSLVDLLIPLGVGSSGNAADLSGCQSLIKVSLLKDHTNVLFQLFGIGQLPSPESHGAVIFPNQV